jgi:signal transduction histidine kinase
MNTVAVALAAAVTPAHVAEAVVTHASVVGARAGTLVIRTSNPDELELVASSGYVSALTEPWRRFSLAAPTPLSEAVRRNAPVWVNSPEAARGRYPSGVFPQGNLAHNHAWAAVPLRLGDRVIGALGLAYQDEQTFTVDQQELLLTFAAQCAQALYRARLHEAEREARLVAEAAVRHRDEFLAVAAHELKTPMTSLRGFTQLELERYQRDATMYPKQTGHSLEIIDLQSGKLADMIVQLFDIAQIDTGKLVLQPQATNLTELVEQVVATFQNRLIHRSIVVDAVPTAIASIDPPRFEQVVTNLLDNAVKYSPEGTAIDVQITRPNDQIVRVSVRDRGRGIVLERRAHIFERYYQADRESPRSGMGLGLYICRQIVELHGGRIWAEFPENGGTRIVVSIPTEKPDETLS